MEEPLSQQAVLRQHRQLVCSLFEQGSLKEAGRRNRRSLAGSPKIVQTRGLVFNTFIDREADASKVHKKVMTNKEFGYQNCYYLSFCPSINQVIYLSVKHKGIL